MWLRCKDALFTPKVLTVVSRTFLAPWGPLLVHYPASAQDRFMSTACAIHASSFGFPPLTCFQLCVSDFTARWAVCLFFLFFALVLFALYFVLDFQKEKTVLTAKLSL